jgi:phosphatidylglycerol:prolipoprotein diacylglycerol transferase
LYIGRRYRDWLKTGDLFLFYLIFYPVLRFGMEFIRLDSSQILGLNANQTLMVILIVVSGAVLSARHRRVRRYQMKTQSPE